MSLDTTNPADRRNPQHLLSATSYPKIEDSVPNNLPPGDSLPIIQVVDPKKQLKKYKISKIAFTAISITGTTFALIGAGSLLAAGIGGLAFCLFKPVYFGKVMFFGEPIYLKLASALPHIINEPGSSQFIIEWIKTLAEIYPTFSLTMKIATITSTTILVLGVAGSATGIVGALVSKKLEKKMNDRIIG